MKSVSTQPLKKLALVLLSLLGMEHRKPYEISPAGRWAIFAGIPLAVCALLFVITEPHHALEHAVGEKAFPYVLAGVPAALMIGGMVLFNHFPKKFVIPLGIVGWIIHVSALCWFFWFGPGAFGHS